MSPTSIAVASYTRSRFPRGFSLIEVVVGCVLLATLLVSTLVALSQQQRKMQFAKDRIQASQLADQLLASWFHSPDGIPLRAEGRFDNQSNLYWQTNTSTVVEMLGQPVPVVMLEVLRSGPEGNVRLLSIDVLAEHSS